MVKDVLERVRPVHVDDCLGEHKKRPLARVGSIEVATQISSMGLKLVSTVILSRLLPPATFGLLAMVVFFRELLKIFNAAGFVEAAIQKKSLTLNQLNGIFWLNIGVSTVLATVFIVCGPLISSFFGESELSAICLVYGLLFLLENFFLTHDALLRRNMETELTFVITFFPQIFGVVVSIAMALYGFGVWALVGRGVSTAIVSRLFYLYFVRWSPGRFSREYEFKGMFAYGFKSSLATVVNYFSRYSQTLALGKFANAAEVGFYNRGQALFQMPIQQVSWPIARLMLPALSALQDDRDKMLRLILRATWLVALIAMPFVVIMAIYGDWIVVWLVGEQWKASGLVTQWLALASIPVLVSNLIFRGNAAIGRPGRGVPVVVLSLPFLLYGIYYYSSGGALAVAKFYAFYRWALYPFLIGYHLKGSGFNIRFFVCSQMQMFLVAGISALVAWLLKGLVMADDGLVKIGITFTATSIAYLTFFVGFRFVGIGREVLEWLYERFAKRIALPRKLFL